MTEDDARRVLLVRAIEEEDAAGDLLTKQDRVAAHEAGRAALSGAGAKTGRKGDDLFLARRAEFAAGRLASRVPAIATALRATRWPRWIGWAVPLGAFLIGLTLNELASGRRLDLLAFPLIGMLAWNALVYFWMLVTLVPRSSKGGPGGLSRVLERLARLGQRGFDRATPVSRALGRFATDWSAASASLAAARSARILHLSAATFALGVVAGIYFRALGIEYRAGWESTFLGPESVHAAISLVLGPAAAVTGLVIPDVAGIAAMRWTGADSGLDSGGVNAGPWIILTTATVIGFVVIPRLVLALLAAVKTWRRRDSFTLPERDGFYFRRLLRGAHGRAGQVRVTPYAYHPDAGVREVLSALTQDALGDGTALQFDPPVDYGAEDDWLAAAEFDADDDHHLLLFTISSTPEHENHGAIASGLRDALAVKHPGTLVGAIIDESPFRERFGDNSASSARLATRGEAWDAVMGRAELASLRLDLAASDPEKAQLMEDLVTGKRHPRVIP
ncbi:hypothetical protein HME9302_00206 [Alteripontixanthobacter maritimus]|uniref:DUF2868 domain-containing protein n=2 Tax=Alteripontixanthobacter maritimus TaxID=2161824 RepID=A0A369Q7X6_9SPHN|nr:hypothetical protein HME9302_00206 [Alteripontixanthobacter maritimus]